MQTTEYNRDTPNYSVALLSKKKEKRKEKRYESIKVLFENSKLKFKNSKHIQRHIIQGHIHTEEL